jgi:membrane protease YdiL (CAAX protease family)
MKQLYSARNGLDAQDLRLFLESQGVAAKVFGDNNAMEIGFAFTPASAPAVFVNEVDFELAEELLSQFFNRSAAPSAAGAWRCGTCGQLVEAQFDLCWRCESPRAEAQVEPPSVGISRAEHAVPLSNDSKNNEANSLEAVTASVGHIGLSNRETWLELGVVLSLAWFPYFIFGLFDDFFAFDSDGKSFAAESLSSILNFLPTIVAVLYIMHRSGEPWSTFGIKRPRLLLDVVLGVSTCLATIVVLTFADILAFALLGTEHAIAFLESDFKFNIAHTTVDIAIIVPLSLAIGVSEELAMRGYLIPRLKRLLNSPSISVFLSSFLFASYHLYQGIGSAIWIFLIGLSFGIAFCWIGRLWPLVIAHAMMDVLSMWPTVE